MGLFAKKIGPVFLKETSDTAAFIEKMQELKKNARPEMEKEIDRQIKLAALSKIYVRGCLSSVKLAAEYECSEYWRVFLRC